METFWAPNGFWAEPHPRQLRFEAKRVEQVLAAFGLTARTSDLIAGFRERWRIPRLAFESFHDLFPTFPTVLEAQSLYRSDPRYSAFARLGRWMTDFVATAVCRRYLVLLDRFEHFCDPEKCVLAQPVAAESRGLPLGMCFPWQGVSGGLIVHNGPPRTGSVFTHAVELNDGRRLRVAVERFTPWLDHVIASGWSPVSLATAPPDLDPPGPGCGPHIRPWLLRACGGDTRTAWLLAWLCWATGPRVPASARVPVVRVDGKRFLKLSRSDLAALTGLSVQQVGDGLTALVDSGLVERSPVRGTAGRIRVDEEALNKAYTAARAGV